MKMTVRTQYGLKNVTQGRALMRSSTPAPPGDVFTPPISVVPVVRKVGVHGVSGRIVGFDVNGGVVEVSNVMEELVFHRVRDRMSFNDREGWRHSDCEVGVESVAFPTNLYLLDGSDASDSRCLAFETIDEVWVYAVHEAPHHLDGRPPQDRDRC